MARIPESPSKTNDILYETFYAGAIGGSALALLFLVSDLVVGRPLFTPSLLGSTLLFGTPLDLAPALSLEAVALFTLVHFALFGVLGLVGSLLVRSMEAHERRPMWVTLVLFGVMEMGALLPIHALAPDLAATLGYTRVSVINLATAAAMVAFLHHARRVEEIARAEARGMYLDLEEDADYDALWGSADRTSVWVPPFVKRR
jgi:hypothetical protein